MTPEQFCYWLQGRAEMQPDNPPSMEEWKVIRDHLATVFSKVTPNYGIPTYVPQRTGAPYKGPPYIAECKAPTPTQTIVADSGGVRVVSDY